MLFAPSQLQAHVIPVPKRSAQDSALEQLCWQERVSDFRASSFSHLLLRSISTSMEAEFLTLPDTDSVSIFTEICLNSVFKKKVRSTKREHRAVFPKAAFKKLRRASWGWSQSAWAAGNRGGRAGGVANSRSNWRTTQGFRAEGRKLILIEDNYY